MRFWDTSAIVPLLLDQPASEPVRTILADDAEVVAWWGTAVECASAAARLRRDGALDVMGEERLLELLATLRGSWLEVLPSEEVRRQATRLLRVHPLRAADALQLAAATLWAGATEGASFVTLDARQAFAAKLEGFAVLPERQPA